MDIVFALVDCNNFFASCERVFKPELNHKPIVVLSGNNGCIIARSDEAKNIGIPMGAPYFKWRSVLKKNGGIAISSDFDLYNNMSHRIMSLLKEINPNMEKYSVDEAFIRLDEIEDNNLKPYSVSICQKIAKYTGIPVSLGIAPTRTLAKIANLMAKKYSKNGVFDIRNKEMRECVLASVSVEDIWGISHRLGQRVRSMGIDNALDLSRVDLKKIKKCLGLAGERVVLELNGIPCIKINNDSHKKTLISSKSFEKPIQNLFFIEEAISNHIAKAATRLREQRCVAGGIKIYLHTSRYDSYSNYYKDEYIIEMESRTDATNIFLSKAQEYVKNIFRKGVKYKKTGVTFFDIAYKNIEQGNFFVSEKEQAKNDNLMQLMDGINYSMGKSSVCFASQRMSKYTKKCEKDNLYKFPLVN